MELPLTHRVLIADDDPSIRRLLVTFLQHEGYQVLEAHNGREALAEMRASNPDLVVLDLVMPELSGWDVLKERAADPSLLRIPVIVVSASNGAKSAEGILDKHVSTVIAKPFDLSALLTSVTHAIEHPDICEAA